MEFSEVVRRRRMVRRYDDRPVEPTVVDRMLDHATRAPSAGFTQGWAFLRLDTPDAVGRFWRATSPEVPTGSPAQGNDWLDGMRTAPVVIVPLSNKPAYLTRYAEQDKSGSDQRWPVPYWHIDTGMAALLILQTAVDEGLGACFFGIPDQRTQAFRDEFGVPPDFKPIGAITVGHRMPDTGSPGSPARRERKDLDEVVHRNGW
ncbi:nitroreductase family protein [Nocardioides jensenii]|uniref:nitroreductase family protein n=1 Tax=Nocardioides jensenii TaxID=1843 RepID=UPI00082A5E68|nr:nitroreductase family protein [Nocardioides jensenii]